MTVMPGEIWTADWEDSDLLRDYVRRTKWFERTIDLVVDSDDTKQPDQTTCSSPSSSSS